MCHWSCVIGLALCAVLVGCGGKDLAQTPQTTVVPEVQITEGIFVPRSGTVRINWLQPNANAVKTYTLERQVGGGDFFPVATASADALTPSAAGGFSLEDPIVVAGEEAIYRLVAETPDGNSRNSETVKVAVPGAKLESVSQMPETATVQLKWLPSNEQVLTYEIVRQTQDGESEVVFVTESSATTSFQEKVLANVLYRYQIQTVLPSGARITSRTERAGFYISARRKQFTNAIGERMRLALVNDRGSVGPSIFLYDQDNFTIRNIPGYEPDGGLLLLEDLPVQPAPFELASLSFAGYPTPTQNQTDHFIVGINSETRNVAVQMYDTNGQSYTWQSDPEMWQIDPMYQRTATTLNNQGHIFVVAGSGLKMFGVSNKTAQASTLTAELTQLGAVDIPSQSDVGGVVITETSIWLSLPDEHRLLQGQMNIADQKLQSVDWQDVPLSSDVNASALAANAHNNILILDGQNKKVWMLDAQGQTVTYLTLDGANFQFNGGLDGDLIAWQQANRDLLYIADASGFVETFITE